MISVYLLLDFISPGIRTLLEKPVKRFLLFCTISLLCATNTLEHPIPQHFSPDCGREG